MGHVINNDVLRVHIGPLAVLSASLFLLHSFQGELLDLSYIDSAFQWSTNG